MQSNGIEYRILKDAAGKNFKVEVKGQFMGFDQWRPLKRARWPDLGLDLGYRVGRVGDRPELFQSCAEAKRAAIDFSAKHLEGNGWTECKC